MSYQFWPPAEDRWETRLMPVLVAAIILLGWLFS
jgi:hypothetical protein